MGEILLEWARNIIFFMVFLSVISHLLADASYEKYIRFFAGIVLILITVSPLKGGLDFQEKAGRFFEEFSFFQEKEQAGKALSKADQERMGAFLAEYKKEAEARIQETMQAEGVICSQAEVEIEKDEKSGEYGKIRKIILHLKEEKMTSPQDEETKMVKEKAGEEVSVKVEIPPVITKEKQERPGTESKQEQQLKRKVAQYYGLEEACIEIWQHEIHIRTAWSNYTYRIFTRGNAVWCEYIGAYRGLLEQKLLPSLTPKMNILDSEVVESSLTGNKRQTLRTYSSENLKLKNFRRDNFKEEYNVTSPQDHPTVVYDEYIKEGMPMPSPYGDSQQSK